MHNFIEGTGRNVADLWNRVFDRDRDEDPDMRGAPVGRKIWLTGPNLIDRIVRAIELNQSVLLAGPRGCGKSHCVRAAINEAQRRGILSLGAVAECQGNREVARDYLMEDDVVFRMHRQADSDKSTDQHGARGAAAADRPEVLPEMRSAPLFNFARRDEQNDPMVDPESDEVVCQIGFGPFRHSIKRFALFLDEINRFSDGVLDGLLSVLEGQEAFLRGRGYRLPVVVLMTMNPPGYDATARPLSPPLAARISRSYTLYTPDLNTLTDLIVHDKLSALEKKMRSEVDDIVHSARQGFATAGDAATQTHVTVRISPVLRRRASFVTLLLWGLPPTAADTDDDSPTRPGMEYLTDDTHRKIEEALEQRPAIRPFLKELSDLCRFGPDGRAAADWLTAATAVARQRGGQRIVVTADDCLDTAIEALSHKIYDDFSPASEPEKLARKEAAVFAISKMVMLGSFDDIIQRQVDKPQFLLQLKNRLVADGDDLSDDDFQSRVYEAFTKAGVTSDDEARCWVDALQNGRDPEALRRAFADMRIPSTGRNGSLSRIDRHPVFWLEDHNADGGICHFTTPEYRTLCLTLSKFEGPLGKLLRALLTTVTGSLPAPQTLIQHSEAATWLNDLVKSQNTDLVELARRHGLLREIRVFVRLAEVIHDLHDSQAADDRFVDGLAATCAAIADELAESGEATIDAGRRRRFLNAVEELANVEPAISRGTSPTDLRRRIEELL